jgi:hypothetical protein
MTVKHLLDLSPGKNNPRNSEGAFLTLSDGRVAFLFSRYSGTSSGDHAYAEIAMTVWDGERFSEPRILVKPEPGTDETNCMSVSAARMNNGDAAVFYLVKHRGISSEYIMRRSADDFETLSDPVRAVSPLYPGYYVVNNDRVIRDSRGRWLVPAAWHPSTMGYHGQPDHVDGRSKAFFCVSEDDGRTWRQASDFLALPGGAHSGSGLQEPGICELPDGSFYAWYRTDLGRQYESFSKDGADFTDPRPSPFTSPCSPMLIKKNPFDGSYLAVWNPTPETPFRWLGAKEPGIWTGGRTPLVFAKSSDGLRFGKPEIVEDDPLGGFCYPAVHFTAPDRFLLSYCAGSETTGDEMCLVRTRIVEIGF